MKIEIESIDNVYSINLIKNGNFIKELCRREFYEDAKSDAKWYKENEYPEAELSL